jgi:hypothetical protein
VLGRFLQDAGRAEEAQGAFERAVAVMLHVRQNLRDERLRDAFEKNADQRLLQDLVARS